MGMNSIESDGWTDKPAADQQTVRLLGEQTLAHISLPTPLGPLVLQDQGFPDFSIFTQT